MAQKPIADTEPRVQQLSDGLYRETGIGPQGLAGTGLCGLNLYNYDQLFFE